MTTATTPPPITFVVRGRSLPPDGAMRGAAGMPPASGLHGGTVLHRVRVGARRGSGDEIRVSARPGQDVVVLHISNGPSLTLHPETARDLMLAQSGLTRGAVEQRLRGQGGGGSGDKPAEVNVPTQMAWQGLEQAGPLRGAARGRLGEVLLSAVEVVTGLLKEPAARLTAATIAARLDAQVDAGVYALRAGAFTAALKGGARLARIPAPATPGAPLLVLLHGTFSETHGTFGQLWEQHPQKVNELFAHYSGRVYALDHPTLGASPIDNTLMLARALPRGARLHLLTHSRGGLVAEVLARVCARPELDEASLAPFKGAAHRGQLKALRELAAVLQGRDIRVERVVRVACPARGTLLASRRLDAYVSVLKWTLELAAIPVAPLLLDFLGEVASHRTDPTLLPGLEAMTPESPLVQWLHASEGADREPLPGQLRVVAGDIEGDSITSWLKTLLADAFYWTDNDLVVQTRSMYGGRPRALAADGQAAATFVLERGGKVTHFAYFGNPRTAQAICHALVRDDPPGFRAIGPLSWAGESSDGLRGGAPAQADRPALILLPGILGSHLAVDGERVWLSLRILGGLGRLAYREGQRDVQPDGAIGSLYGDLAAFLAQTHEVTVFPFDWRRPIEEEAVRLASVIDEAVGARAASRQPVHLLAHSMGGLVARAVQLERPDVWQRWRDHPGTRLLMLGTPNGGSFAPMQVLSGDDPMGNALAAFGLPFQDHKARTLMAAMPGFLQLQAGLTDASTGLAQSARWQALADQDMETLRQANWWHDADGQRAIYRWGVPPQSVLDRAVALRERLDRQRDEAPGAFKDRVVMVVGQARFTPAGFELNEREGLVYLDRPERGDGRVTLENALLPGVRAWRVPASHGDLPDAGKAFEAYLELLESGQTTLLTELATSSDARDGLGSGTSSDSAGSSDDPGLPLVRSRPSRQRNAAPVPPADPLRLPGLDDESPARLAPRHAALRVSVHNGNLRFVNTPLMVGHYVASKLTGTEGVVDRFIGGAMSASLAAGLYPESPGAHQFFVNNAEDPDNPLAAPRPPHVVVAGLGEEGKLRSTSLTHTVRQAALAWAQRMGETAGTSQFELAATLIGSGGSGMTVFASAQAVAQGVREANEKLAQGDWPQVSHLHLIELYLDRATEAWSALRLLASAAPEHFAVDERIHPIAGGLRQPLDNGYRGTPYDFISAIAEKDENGQTHILYTLDTQRARADVRAQGTQAQLVGELVRRASNDAHTGSDVGRTLFQLLVPAEMEASLGGTSELLLELNDGTAAIPWEMLDAPDDGRGPQHAPWAIRNKLLRRLRTAEFRTQISDARPDDAVLVIGEPLCNTKDSQGRDVYPRLPGARLEAELTRDVLARELGDERVHALIATDGQPGPDAVAVTTALLARRYRLVHIAGHGEADLAPPDLPPQPRGVVLSDGTFLGAREVEAMRVVPELVFLNCCHLAADPGHLLRAGYDRARFAAGVARQLIRIGVRCVIAAGWAVEDEPAHRFATAFYREVLAGRRFMDAVQAGRVAAHQANPRGNTWAAYQCYGDPDWVLRPAPQSERQETDLAQTYAGLASPAALILALETLAVQSRTQGRPAETQRQHIGYLETRFGDTWGAMGAVAEAFGMAWAATSGTDQAMAWLHRAVSANDGGADVKAAEQLADLATRRAWERLSAAVRHGGAPLPPLIRQGRTDIREALRTLDALTRVAPTLERESLLGAACKRMAQLEGVAGQTAAQRKAIEKMAAHCARAEALALRTGQIERHQPGLNLLAAEWLLHGGQRGWPGPDRERLRRVRESLERQQREDPDFWSAAGLSELEFHEALATQTLDAKLPAIFEALSGLRERIGTKPLWASLADHWGFVLAPLSQGPARQARAARELLAALQGWAGAA